MNLYEAFDRTVSVEPKKFPLSEDASITLRPMASDEARRKFDQLMEPYSARLNVAGGKLTEEENKRLNLRFFSEYVVVGWEGLNDTEGKPVKFSAENASKLFEALPRFFNLVVKIASDEDSFIEQRTAEDEKNS